jgi:hypothetical protein
LTGSVSCVSRHSFQKDLRNNDEEADTPKGNPELDSPEQISRSLRTVAHRERLNSNM